jgi:beta-glucanase (GH16 family)
MLSLSRSRLVFSGVAAVAASVAFAQPALAAHTRLGARSLSKPTRVATTTVAPPAVSTTVPVRIAASTTTVSDASGRQFKADAPYANGGQLVATLVPTTGTASPALYMKGRLGGTGYTVPVSTPGTYFVDMFVSETRGAQPGQRVWNVTAEGTTVATSVDAARDAGANRAWHVMFSAPVTDGALNLSLVGVTGIPLVGAVEVDYQSADAAATTVLAQDFNGTAGTSPSATRWTAVNAGNGFGNRELETYTGRTSNVSLDGAGHLAITARQETYTGTDGFTRNYTSGRVDTHGKFEFQYGTAVARMQVPAGQGLWPAFWALGSNIDTDGWPLCGEIDVVENVGSEPTTAHATLHASGLAGLPWLAGGLTNASAPLSGGYHDYGMVWGPNAISVSLDGDTYFAVSASDIAPGNNWNFNHPFYLLLNLAVGGTWPGSPDATTQFPATMSVDFVHVTA